MNRLTNKQIKPLKKWNLAAGTFHLLSLIAIIIFSNDFSLPVTATYLSGPPGSAASAPVLLFSLNVAYAVALFFALSAFFHFLVASKPMFSQYVSGLKQKINVFRWVEYSLSSTIMIILIAQLTGISNYATLLAIAGTNVAMILFGWLQEKHNEPRDGQWLPFIFGSLAGIIPWIIIAVQLITPGSTGNVSTPGFVYGIVFSLFVLFNCFALVQYLQYRAKGKWSDYLRGEKAYIILSFTAKSLLAWQIFANTLVA